ncbi:MAG: hypothetical protein K9L88_01370 [Chromatiaceae bacterium]|nr:hypothetical protein [Chromatiaceae bacterium]
MQCIFHCGLNKAGSTYLQEVFASSQGALKNEGIAYPPPYGPAGNGANLALAIQRLDRSSATAALRKLVEAAGGSRKLLLSTEYLYHLLIRKQQRDLFLDVMEAEGLMETRLVVVFRNIYAHAISAYSHRVGKHNMPDFSSWILDRTHGSANTGTVNGVAGYELWEESRLLRAAIEASSLNFEFFQYDNNLSATFSQIIGVDLRGAGVRSANVSVNLFEARILARYFDSYPALVANYRARSKELDKCQKASDGLLREACFGEIENEIEKNRATVEFLERAFGFSISTRPNVDTNADDAESFVTLSTSQLDELVKASGFRQDVALGKVRSILPKLKRVIRLLGNSR